MTEQRHGKFFLRDEFPPVVGNHSVNGSADRVLLSRPRGYLKERRQPFGDVLTMSIFWAIIIALLFIPAFLLG
jgi:hypothetical protein